MAVESSAHLPPQVYTVKFGLSSPNYGILQGVKVKKPAVNRERFVVLGKYLDDALTLANMTQSELARRAGLRSSSYLSRVMKGEREVERPTLLSWCAILNCPDWLEERILNAAGYASEQQRKAVEKEEVLEETHETILKEVARRGKGNTDQ
jgi:transcriptional regulator with XRE-family HTH domain